MKNFLKIILIFLAFLVAVILASLFIFNVKPAQEISWGVNFSQGYAEKMGLDWKETYLAMLSDLGAKNLKVSVDWDIIEPERGNFYFDDLDWQLSKAKQNNAKIIPIVGMKTSRWPECHIPDWANNLSKEIQQAEILKMIEAVVLRYKDDPTIKFWQIENEPFFPFGECPWVDKQFLKLEVDMVHEKDILGRPVIISDSGEGSFWISAAKIGDMVGTTMYKKVWFTFPDFFNKYLLKNTNGGIYVYYPLPPAFYGRKAEIIERFFHKEVICIEFQAEPWAYKFITELPMAEQEKTMNLERFKENIEFAKKTGIAEFYLWGVEWMYWMKEKQGRPEIWQEAQKLFIEN